MNQYPGQGSNQDQPPGYGPLPQGYGPPYGYPTMASQPPNKSRKGLWITLGVIGGVLVLCCAIGVGLVIYAAVQVSKPISVAQSFCDDLKAQDYNAAYTLTSAGYQSRVSQLQFVQRAQNDDQTNGKVTSCKLQTNSFNFNFNTSISTFTVAIQITRNQTTTGNLTLVKHGSNWTIDAVDASLLSIAAGSTHISTPAGAV
jgi:hypothetical protein